MKLSHLVQYLNYLDQHDASRTQAEIAEFRQYFDDVFHYVGQQDLQFPGVKDRMQMVHDDWQQSLATFDQAINDLKNLVLSNIEIWEPSYFRISQTYYDQIVANATAEQLPPQPDLTDEVENYIKSRLALYCDWHHPGLLIHPISQTVISNMVAADPLYLVDSNYDIMANALEHFPAEYQSRVRKCVMPEKRFNSTGPNSQSSFHDTKLPIEQMGVAVAYNYFNHRPLSFIMRYTYHVLAWLKPGGTFCFTFNNCDRASAVELVEKNAACYTPGRLLLTGLEQNGWQIQHVHDINASTTWAEIKKTGTLASQRAGQSLARPVAKATRNQ